MRERARADEIPTMECCTALHCLTCRGSGRKPMPGYSGYFWADGVWRKAKPPSEEPIAVKAPNGYAAAQAATLGRETPKLERERPRKPLPKTFKPTAITLLRAQALGFAISAASLIYRSGTSAAQLLKDAEYIARWIADTPTDHREGKPKS